MYSKAPRFGTMPDGVEALAPAQRWHPVAVMPGIARVEVAAVAERVPDAAEVLPLAVSRGVAAAVPAAARPTRGCTKPSGPAACPAPADQANTLRR